MQDDIDSAKPYANVNSGRLSESRSAPGGCQLIVQIAYLTFESACRLL